ncbi:hypothetical protein J2X19_001759 [Rhodoferax ferrireducens]|uniref:Prokaryotic YEATS domain-containing protein n=1 Tax=Rhodoferax ferrireducens TaxID=192843 RepID=A0ABU2C728_9BURK|nr:pYEATS domain-containing protein [Rhodoferax ferrireducens]MDR7377101.1 hypothetical protein [Rhodoferax ferrireducens]
MAEPKTWMDVVVALAWPILVGGLMFTYRDLVRSILVATVARVQRGDEIKIGIVSIGQAVGQLKVPLTGELLTDDHLALIHRSRRVPERDIEFGSPMHQIHVIVFGTTEALLQVEYVVYRLEDAYPNPVQAGGSPDTNFELKELANGHSLIRAEVHVRGQAEPVRLSRFIDLTDDSPPLKGTYQTMVSRGDAKPFNPRDRQQPGSP